MLIEKKLLVEERSDHCDRLRVHLALSQILYDNGAQGCFNEVLVFEPLSLLNVQVTDDLVAFQERDTSGLDTLKPGEHGTKESLGTYKLTLLIPYILPFGQPLWGLRAP